MNDTNLTLRQRKILEIISDKPVSRPEIGEKLKSSFPVSRATLIRDLNLLIKNKLIKKVGVGKKAGYLSTETNPVIKYFDTEKYFSSESDRGKTGPIPFNFKVFDNLHDLVESIDSPKLSEQEAKLDPTIFRREIERFTIEFSWKSSKIEGNTYSLLETEILIKQMKEASGHSKHEAIMILNHKYALDFILKNRGKFKKISLETIIGLHSILTKDLEVSTGIRSNPVAISGSNYLPLAPQKDIEIALNKLFKITNITTNPLEKALIILAMVSYIQAFSDGNKRTARVLANAVLIAHDYYPVSFRSVEAIDYIKPLIIFYEKNNLYPFRKMFLDQYQFSLENYFRTN